jgi:hypothetical protein
MSEKYGQSGYDPNKENEIESKEGKDFSPPTDDNNEPASPNLASASDKMQADIKSLRGEYGQSSNQSDSTTTSEPTDAQSKYDQSKSEHLKDDYGQSGKQSDSTPTTSEPTNDIKS